MSAAVYTEIGVSRATASVTTSPPHTGDEVRSVCGTAPPGVPEQESVVKPKGARSGRVERAGESRPPAELSMRDGSHPLRGIGRLTACFLARAAAAAAAMVVVIAGRRGLTEKITALDQGIDTGNVCQIVLADPGHQHDINFPSVPDMQSADRSSQ